MKTMTYKDFIKYNIKHYFIIFLYFIAFVFIININKIALISLFYIPILLIYLFFNLCFSVAALFALFKKSNIGEETLMDYEYTNKDDFANYIYKRNYKILRICMLFLNIFLVVAVIAYF